MTLAALFARKMLASYPDGPGDVPDHLLPAVATALAALAHLPGGYEWGGLLWTLEGPPRGMDAPRAAADAVGRQDATDDPHAPALPMRGGQDGTWGSFTPSGAP